MALTMESQKFSHMDSLRIDSRRAEPLSSLRSFYTVDNEVASKVDEELNSAGIWRAATPDDLPAAAVMPITTSQLLDRKVIAAMTGPDSGFQAAREWKDRSTSKTLVCGTHVFVDNWKEIPHPKAFGKSISLYDTNPVTGRTSGDPIADAFVVKVRGSSAFVAVADGVNWGEAPMRAARCAVNAVYEHLETNLLLGGPEALKIRNTRDAAKLLFRAFRQAHEDIVSQTHGLTTLCVGLLLPVHLGNRQRRQRSATGSFSDTSASTTASAAASDNGSGGSGTTRSCATALIVASVGDSQAFLLHEGTDAIEVTGWVPPPHAEQNGDSGGDEAEGGPPERDFRDAGGALGPVYDSDEPELQNLMCAVALCDPRDVIIFGTDGLTDNFDPVVVRIAIPRSPDITFVDDDDGEDAVISDLPEVNTTTTTTTNNNNNATASIDSLQTKAHQLRLRGFHKWAKMAPISTPYALPVWPKPPPPPPPSSPTSIDNPTPLTPPPPRPRTHTSDDVSARSLNYTNQLELTWPERRQYASKELTRIWYELERTENATVSAEAFGEALLKHVRRVTAQKRQFLEAPETTKLKAQFSRYMRKKNSMKEKARPQSAVAALGAASDSGVGEKDKELLELERKRGWVMDSLKRMPGKLDHATVVVLQVGSE